MGVKVGLLIDLSSLPESGDWEQHVQLIQETILERMVLDASFSGQFDVSDLVWTYKFYHSSYVFPNNKYWLKFLPFNVKEFDDFEVNMLNEMQSVYGEGPGPSSNFKDNIVQLREALKAMLSCLEWVEDIDIGRTSRNASKQQRRSKFTTPHPEDMLQDSPSGQEIPFNRNTIYVFTRVPRSESDLVSFLNNNSSGTSSERLISALIGYDFYERLKNNCTAQVKFVDTGYYFPNSDTDFNNVYPFPLQKALSSLGHVGCLVPTLKAYDHGRSGFPSWKTLLKNQMCSGANVGYNLLGLLKGRNNADVFPSRVETSKLQISSQPSAMVRKRKYHGHSEQAERRSHRQSRQIQIRAAMSEQTRQGERSVQIEDLLTGKINRHIQAAYTAQKPLREEKRLSSSRTQNSQHLAFEKSLRMESERSASTSRSSQSISFLAAQNPKRQILTAQSSKFPRNQKDDRTAAFVQDSIPSYSFTAPVHRPSPSKRVRRNLFFDHSSESGGAKDLGLCDGNFSLSRYSTSANAGSFSMRSPTTSSTFRSPVAGFSGYSSSSLKSPSTSSRFMALPFASRTSESPQSRFSKSPLGIFTSHDGSVSPSTKNIILPRHPSAKRQLTLEEFKMKHTMNSPQQLQFVHVPGFHGVICPESPSTPPQKRIKTSSVNSASSCEKRDVVPESPETFSQFQRKPLSNVDTSTFYGKAQPAKAWESSCKQFEAAKLKNSVRLEALHSQALSLSLEDLDFLPGPNPTQEKASSNYSLPAAPQTFFKMEDSMSSS